MRHSTSRSNPIRPSASVRKLTLPGSAPKVTHSANQGPARYSHPRVAYQSAPAEGKVNRPIRGVCPDGVSQPIGMKGDNEPPRLKVCHDGAISGLAWLLKP